MEYIGVPKYLHDMIEELIKASSEASAPTPTTNKDWEIVVRVYELWKAYFPQRYKSFIKSAEIFREAHVLNKGIVKEGDSLMQHRLEMDEQLYMMIKKVFPVFKLNEDTIGRFVTLLPEFSVSNDN